MSALFSRLGPFVLQTPPHRTSGIMAYLRHLGQGIFQVQLAARELLAQERFYYREMKSLLCSLHLI